MATNKAIIVKVGTFDANGNPVGWTFQGGSAPAINFTENGMEWAGYTVTELQAIYNANKSSDTDVA